MDVVLSKAQLLLAVALPQNLAQKKAAMPVLANLLLSAEKNAFHILGSDLEVSTICVSQAAVRREGAIAVDGKIFGSLVRQLPEGDVHLRVVPGDRLEITAQRSVLKLPGVSASTFPKAPGMEYETSGKISASQLAKMLDQTLYATSQDETRFNLNGVFFQTNGFEEEGELVLVSTDGYRLAHATCLIKGFKFKNPIIVPRRGLTELRKALEFDGESDVGIGVEKSFLIVETSQSKLSLRLIDGEYPDYRQVLPSRTESEAIVTTELLVNALRRSLLVVHSDEKCSFLTFSDGLLKIRSESAERGEVDEELEVEYSGESLRIGFSPEFLLDALQAYANSSLLRIQLSGLMGPAVISAKDDEKSFSVVMPMRR
jgi:DNA polymerase III subunit beta